MSVISQITTYNENSYEQLYDFMKNSYVTLTFFGGRRVRAIGYKESIGADDLAWRILHLYESHKEINRNEHDLFVKIEKKISKIEEISEDLAKNAHLVTKLFICVKNIFALFLSFDPNPFTDLYYSMPNPPE